MSAVDENFNATDADVDSVVENLSIMADYEIKLVTNKTTFTRTSFLVNRTEVEGGFQGYSNSTDNACRWCLNFMKRKWFDLCRDDERFKEVERKCEKYAN